MKLEWDDAVKECRSYSCNLFVVNLKNRFREQTYDMNDRARTLIATLELAPHPEGGYFREVYRAESTVVSPVNGAVRASVTDIYFLLTAGQVSRFHRVLHDEIWHFYEGDPLELIELDPQFSRLTRSLLRSGASPWYRHCIRGGLWQAAASTGEYSLVGCTVAPGFDFADFTFMSEGERAAVQAKFPELKVFL